MRRRPAARHALTLALCLAAGGLGACATLPADGTLVYLDHRSGDWWDGEGVLTDVSPDQTSCQVAGRNRILFVETKWVPCKYVHERSPNLD